MPIPAIKFDILNRFSGAVQFTAEIECAADALPSIKLGLAVKVAVKSGAYLSGADLSGADLSGAYLSRADLSRADLSRADLSGADLSRADLSGKTLAAGNSLAVIGTPDHWSAFTYFTEGGEQRVCVGCRDFTLAEGREYWKGKDDRREVMAALDYAEAIGRIREWVKAPAKEAA